MMRGVAAVLGAAALAEGAFLRAEAPSTSLRSRNFDLCRTKVDRQAPVLRHFGLDASSLPPDADIRLCEDRQAPHAGVLYVANFITKDELAGLRRSTVALLSGEARSDYAYYVWKGEEDRLAHPAAAAFENRVRNFTSFSQGTLQLAATGDRMPLLHHDHAKGFIKRQVTSVLYLDAPESGGHTVFPFLELSNHANRSVQEPAILASTLRDMHLDVLRPYSYTDAKGGATTPGSRAWQLTKQKCEELALADKQGLPSSHFGVRPAAGDALFFWQLRSTGKLRADDAHFHAGCPARGGRKVALQKFAEGLEDADDGEEDAHVPASLLQAMDSAFSAYEKR